METLQCGNLVYIPCSEPKSDVAFLAGEIVEVSDDVVGVQLVSAGDVSSEEIRQVPRADVRFRFAQEEGRTCQDNTSLVHMNDATILENLRLRHRENIIYTYTASVLLAVNPYKQIEGLYGDSQCARYRGKHIGALPPHPYAIADTAYRALVREQRNQGLLISGESGAGKTETAKIVMNFLAYASGAASDLASRIQSRVLQAQPILESFGNAVTMRNSNSSRFGKYNRVFFDEEGTLVDAGVTTYLLESSRVVVHGEKERTYHCFYEMLTGVSDAKLAEFKLERNRCYRLMTNGDRPVAGYEERDCRNFKRLFDALQIVGFTEEDVNASLQVLAGLVHLGDAAAATAAVTTAPPPVAASDEDDDLKCVELDEESVGRAAALLGMHPEKLGGTLKRKCVAVPGRDELYEVPRSETQFRQALHSLIKALYKRLFERIVKRINESFQELRPNAGADGATDEEEGAVDALRHIGILDIYGFERLQTNSFEQLCINLANERLQQYFVENVLMAEQQLYKREGLPWIGLSLPDSEPVVSCIAQVFKTLDELSQKLAKGMDTMASDERFCQKIVEEAMKNPKRKDVLKQVKMSVKRRGTTGPSLNEGFLIQHYAGWVEYSTKGWLDKNNDRLLSECEALICESDFPLVRSLGEFDLLEGKGERFRSISGKYSRDLEALLKTLGTCNLHYIRCFKPNDEQKPKIFKQQLLLDQLVQCGTVELVKIMHDGYPNRCPFEEITTRFRGLLPERFSRYGMRTFIEALMLAYEVPREEWALGMSRLFLKAGQLRALEDMRSGGAQPNPEKLAEIVRGIVRKRWVRAIHAVRLCLYIPKFISEIHVRRATKALARATILTGRLAPRLEAARQRVRDRRQKARRRLAGLFRTVIFFRKEWSRLRAQRKERLVTALYRATILSAKLKPLIADVRDRRQQRRDEEERRLEAERRRVAEEEKRLQEQRRQIEEERRRVEAERLRIEEEERQRQEQERLEAQERREKEAAEAQRRQEEEERLREERLRKEQEEREDEEERQKEEAERRREEQEQARAEMQKESERLAAEREKLEEAKREFEQQKDAHGLRSDILASASPQHRKQDLFAVPDSEAHLLPCADLLRPQSTRSSAQEDDFDMIDSASASASVSAVTTALDRQQLQQEIQQEVAKEFNRRLQELENEQLQKQAEVLRMMEELQKKNNDLERQMASPASPNSRRPVNSPADDRGRASPLELNMTPKGSSGTKKHKRTSMSSRRISLISLEGSRRNSITASSKASRRRSVASEAFTAGRPDAAHCLGESAFSAEGLGKQRNLWAEQRSFLIDELYPEGYPGSVGPIPMARRRKSSQAVPVAASEPVAAPSSDAAGFRAASEEANTAPAAVEEEPEMEQQPPTPSADGEPASLRLNLVPQFEATDSQTQPAQGSRLKQPTRWTRGKAQEKK